MVRVIGAMTCEDVRLFMAVSATISAGITQCILFQVVMAPNGERLQCARLRQHHTQHHPRHHPQRHNQHQNRRQNQRHLRRSRLQMLSRPVHLLTCHANRTGLCGKGSKNASELALKKTTTSRTVFPCRHAFGLLMIGVISSSVTG